VCFLLSHTQACGHRYRLVEEGAQVFGLGMCFQYNPELTLQQLQPYKSPCVGSPLTDKNNAYSAYGVCAAGMGLDVQVILIIAGGMIMSELLILLTQLRLLTVKFG